MKILIFGSHNAFCNSLISRLKRERHEVYSVCKVAPARKNKNVFQQYVFDYCSKSVLLVTESVSPDIVLFMGAKDSCYNWVSPEITASELLGGLTNVLACSKKVAPKKFVFISDCSVYADNHELNVDHITNPDPKSTKNQALLQAESVCRNYQHINGLDLSIVRISDLYGDFENQKCETNLIKAMFAVDKKNVPGDLIDDLIHVKDATDGVFRVITAEQTHPIYILASGSDISANDILNHLNLDDNNQGVFAPMVSENVQHHIFDNLLLRDLGFNVKYNVKNEIASLRSYIYSLRQDAFTIRDNKKPIKTLYSKIRPVIDNIFFFAITMILQFALSSTNIVDSLDLFLWYTLIIIVVHHLNFGLFAVILSIIGKLSFLLYTDQLVPQLESYQFYFWLLQLIVFALIVSNVKQKYEMLYQASEEENTVLLEERAVIKDVNEKNVAVRQEYERRLVNYRNSLANLYEMVSRLDQMESQYVVFQATGMLGEMMASKDVSIYICSQNSDFCRLISSTSELSATMGKTIKMERTNPLFKALFHQEIYSNNAMDKSMPVLAGGTYRESKLSMVIMIWTMPLESPNLYNNNVLTLLCRIVEHSLNRAYNYMNLLEPSTFIDGTRVMSSEAFNKMLETYKAGAADNMMEYVLLELKKEGRDSYPKLSKLVRETDYLGEDEEGNIFALLSNTNRKDLDVVLERLKTAEVEVINQSIYEKTILEN